MKRKDWFKISLEYQDRGDYAQALISIRKYIQDNPKNKRAKLLEAVYLADLSSFNYALEVLRKIKPKKSDDERYKILYHRELGDIYKETGKLKKAIRQYDKIIELSPKHTKGYIFKGCCLALYGKYKSAIENHKKAVILVGDPEEAYYNLALIYRAKMELEQAKKYCKEAIKIDQEYSAALECLEDIYGAIKLRNKFEKEMEIKELPNRITELLEKLNSPERLKRHLQIVHSTAYKLLTLIRHEWPKIDLNEELILFGAGTHDIGKTEITIELIERGKKHELKGKQILLELGYTENESRFAQTHGNWKEENITFEDLLVSLADKIWKGKRIEELEEKIGRALSDKLRIDYLEVYSALDKILEQLSYGADERILWQNQ